MFKIFALLTVIAVCGRLSDAFSIRKVRGKTCLPPNATLIQNFKPDLLLNGKIWYAIAGPPSSFDPTCYYGNGTYDASSNSVALTSTGILRNAVIVSETDYFKPDADNSAVYNLVGDVVQIAVLDTDYVNYVVVAGCEQPEGTVAFPGVLSISPKKPTNYDDIVAKLTAQGFSTNDSEIFALYKTSGCPQFG